MHRANCVLRKYPDHSDPDFFEEVMAAVDDLQALGLDFEVVEEESFERNLHIVWEAQEELGSLTLTSDDQTEICSIAVAVAKAHDLRKIIEALQGSLGCWTLDELQHAARTQRVMQPNLLLQLALVARRLDRETLELLRSSLQHRFPQVRYYAAYGVGILLWSEFIPDLELLLKGEPDSDVEEMAQRALAGCQQQLR